MVEIAVIPAAGFGTRVLPASKVIPKELFPIYDRPAIHLIALECIKAGIKEIVLVISRRKMDIIRYFEKDEELENFLLSKGREKLLRPLDVFCELKISWVFQEEQKGLGHAVLCAKDRVGNRSFAVLLPDDIFVVENGLYALKKLISIFQMRRPEGGVLLLSKVSDDDVERYGIVKPTRVEDDHIVYFSGVVEKPDKAKAPSRFAVVGRYIFSPEIFKWLETEPEDGRGEIQLAGAIGRFSEQGGDKFIGVVMDGVWLDIGSPDGYVNASEFFARNKQFLD